MRRPRTTTATFALLSLGGGCGSEHKSDAPPPVHEDRAKPAWFADLYGAHPASAGRAFAGVALGAPQAGPDKSRSFDLPSNHHADLIAANGELDQIDYFFPDRDPLPVLLKGLRAAWGPSTFDSARNRDYWFDAQSHQRAWLGVTDFVIERYTPVATWTPTPWTDLIGLTSTDLATRTFVMHAKLASDGRLFWTEPGFDASEEPIELDAVLEDGRVTTINVNTRVATHAVFERLSALLGTPQQSTFYLWPGPPELRYSETEQGHVTLIIGRHDAGD